MPMSPRLLRPRASGATHPEAREWATRVTANGGTVSSTTLAAVSTFCASIQAAGIRNRFSRLNLFCGNSDASLNAVRTPLYLSSSFGGSVLGDSTDTNVNFVQGDYAETGASGGLKGNGINKHLLTGLLASTFSHTDNHLAIYGEDFNSGSNFGFGVAARGAAAANPIALWVRISSTAANRFDSTTTAAGVTAASAITSGHLIGSTVAINDIRIIQNGSQSDIVTSTRTVGTPAAIQFAIFGVNDNGSVGSRTAARLSAYSIGNGLTNTQAAAYYTALHAFQTTLGRQK